MATPLTTDTAPDNLDKLLLTQIDPDKYRGYDKKILALNLNSAEELLLTCKVCNGIMKDAVSDKGENMCSSCFYNSYISKFAFPATDIRDKVNKLQCKCPLRDRGCKWLGTVSEVYDHIKTVCPKLLIRCSLKCEAILCNELLESHKQCLCPNRIIQCEYCNDRLESKQMNEHLSKCEYCTINCNLECGAKMIRKYLEAHINTICPLAMAILECPYAKWGCAIKDIKRKDMKEHMQTNLLEHTNISFNHINCKLTEYSKDIIKQKQVSKVLKFNLDISSRDIIKHKQVSKELQVKLDNSFKENIQQKAKLTECSKDIMQQKTKLVECSKDIIEQKQVSEGLQVKLDNNSKENIQQKAKLTECSKDIMQQKAKLVECSEDIMQQKAKLTECSKDIMQQKAKLVECSEDITEQKQVSEGLQVKLDNNSKENMQQKAKLTECSKDIIEQKQVSEGLQNQFEQCSRINLQFRDALQNDIYNLRDELVRGTFGFVTYRSSRIYVCSVVLILLFFYYISHY